MEEPSETRDLANGVRELEVEQAAAAPDVVEEEEEPPRSATTKQEEAKAAMESEGSRPFTMRELLGELKEDGEAARGADGGGARSGVGEGSGVESADAEGSSYRIVRD